MQDPTLTSGIQIPPSYTRNARVNSYTRNARANSYTTNTSSAFLHQEYDLQACNRSGVGYKFYADYPYYTDH